VVGDGPGLSKPGDSGEMPRGFGAAPTPPPPPQPGWTLVPDGTVLQPPPGAVGAAHGVPYGYGFGGAPPFAKPSTNLVGAILATLFCCLPTGIVAIVFAAQVDSKWNVGDWHGAKDASRKAQMWANVSLGLAILGALGYGALFAVGSNGGSGY